MKRELTDKVGPLEEAMFRRAISAIELVYGMISYPADPNEDISFEEIVREAECRVASRIVRLTVPGTREAFYRGLVESSSRLIDEVEAQVRNPSGD